MTVQVVFFSRTSTIYLKTLITVLFICRRQTKKSCNLNFYQLFKILIKMEIIPKKNVAFSVSNGQVAVSE